MRFHADVEAENSAKPCDTGSPVSKVSAEFPSVDFSKVDPVFPDKTSPAGAHYAYTKTALLNRAQASLERLYSRPEKIIIVVSHSAFMRTAVTGCWFFNADYRVFEFAERKDGDDQAPYSLVQSVETAEKGGGLGWSWNEKVVLGTNLPDEVPDKVV